MDIAYVLFPQFTALDLVGPYNVLSYGPGVRTHLVAERRGAFAADVGTLSIEAEESFDELRQVDVVVVPGGPGWQRIAGMSAMCEWLGDIDAHTTFTTSVCTGAFALGAAGLLQGRRATTHWATVQHLEKFGASYEASRVVVDGKYVTGAGVSAGIDMAFTVAGRIWGDDVARTIQLANEYDPQPPYQSGSPASAPASIVESLRSSLGG